MSGQSFAEFGHGIGSRDADDRETFGFRAPDERALERFGAQKSRSA
jgi:hypothetical protein